MEADWEMELGGEAPVIDACWPGMVDLRSAPETVNDLEEPLQLPALADTLLRLNGPASAVRTTKCDVWPAESFDRYELDAPPEQAITAVACYIDLLSRNVDSWTNPRQAEDICRQLCAALHAIPLRCCRADLMVRAAVLTPTFRGLGITAYLTACGSTEIEAASTLASALVALADAIASPLPALSNQTKLQ